MRVKSAIATAVVTAMVLVAAGCATKPEIVESSGPRPAAPPEQVKIYPRPPLRYERLGVVTVPATRDTPWDARGNADAGFDRLKEEAARRGANGLLLVVDRPEYYGRVLAGYHDTFYEVPYRLKPEKAAVAEAIYVHKEY
jgi:hypothetical protein